MIQKSKGHDLTGYWRVAGWGAILVGTFIRFFELGRWPLWCDELASLQRTALPVREHLAELSARAPLFEMVLRFWEEPGMTDAQLRAPSAIFGVIALWVIWRAARNVAGEFVGALTAVVIALSPLHIMFSRIAREYSMAVMLAAVSTYALWKIYSDPRRRWLILYGITTLAALYTTYIMCGIVLAHNIFIISMFRRERARLLSWFKTQATVGLLFAPWFIVSIAGAMRFASGTPYAPHQVGLPAKAAYLAFALCAGETISPLNLPAVLAAAMGFGAAGISGAIRSARRDKRLAWFLLPPVAVIYAAGIFFAAASPKHLSVIMPAMTILLAVGIAYLKPKFLQYAAAGLIILTSVYSIYNYFTGEQFADASMVTPWRDIAETIRQREAGGETIFIGWRTINDRFGTDMDLFKRYYEGGCEVAFLPPEEWERQAADSLERDGSLWILLHRDEPIDRISAELSKADADMEIFHFQEEEEVLRRIRESGERSDFVTHLYILIWATRKTD